MIRRATTFVGNLIRLVLALAIAFGIVAFFVIPSPVARVYGVAITGVAVALWLFLFRRR